MSARQITERMGRQIAEGEYLARYEDSDEPDPGSRCGYSDSELAAFERGLASRGLRLIADDRGLRVIAGEVQS